MIDGITILICTFNGKSNLTNTLQGLSKLNLENIPYTALVLVDNASTDDTSNFTKRKWEELGNIFPIQIIKEENPGKINAQNTGLKIVKTKYVLICDDDNELYPDYLGIGYQLLKSNSKIGALGGRGVVKSEVEIPKWFDSMAYMFACAPQAKKTGDVRPERNVIYGAGMFLNMTAFDISLKAGFDYLLPSRIGKSVVTGAEDGEICWWLRFAGFEIWYSEDLIFNHHIKPSRLTDEYHIKLLTMFKIGFPVGKLYLRIFNGELRKPIKFFWLKESLYTIKYILKIPFMKRSEKKMELKRSASQLLYFLKERRNYDNNYHKLLGIYNSLNVK